MQILQLIDNYMYYGDLNDMAIDLILPKNIFSII